MLIVSVALVTCNNENGENAHYYNPDTSRDYYKTIRYSNYHNPGIIPDLNSNSYNPFSYNAYRNGGGYSISNDNINGMATAQAQLLDSNHYNTNYNSGNFNNPSYARYNDEYQTFRYNGDSKSHNNESNNSFKTVIYNTVNKENRKPNMKNVQSSDDKNHYKFVHYKNVNSNKDLRSKTNKIIKRHNSRSVPGLTEPSAYSSVFSDSGETDGFDLGSSFARGYNSLYSGDLSDKSNEFEDDYSSDLSDNSISNGEIPDEEEVIQPEVIDLCSAYVTV